MIVFNWNVASKIMDRKFIRVKYNFSKIKLPCEMWETLEVGILVVIANDLDDLKLILRGKGFLASNKRQ